MVLAEVGEGTIFVDEDVVAACVGAVVGAGCTLLACAISGTRKTRMGDWASAACSIVLSVACHT